jgi:hypothetical protein
LRKHNDEVSIQEIIDDVRRQLSDNGVRITDGLLSFERAWWPNEPDFQTQLLSDRGVLPGPKEVVDEFYAEVLAIQKTIEKHDSAAAAKMDSGDKVMAAADRRARALKFWEQCISVPTTRCRRVPHFRTP